MAKIQHSKAIEIFRGNSREVELRPIRDRQFVMDVEKQIFYVDVGKDRIKFGQDFGDEFYSIYGRIKEVETKIGTIESTVLTQEDIENLINLKIEDVINNDVEISNKINDVFSKIETLDETVADVVEKVNTVTEKVTELQETKQEKILNFSDTLKADQWNQFDDGDAGINEYYYRSDKIPEDVSQITIVPAITTGEQYEIIADAVLFSSIEHVVREGTSYYIIRAKKIPAGDIDVFISVIR